MSVSSLLANDSATENRAVPKAIVRRIIKKTVQTTPQNQIQPPQVTTTYIQQPQPVVRINPVQVKTEKYVPLENILTFNIVAKFKLSKEEIEELNSLFFKLTQGKLSTQMLNMKVNNIIKDKSDVLICWNILTQKANSMTAESSPFVSKVREIINWFISNGNSEETIDEYFCFINDNHVSSQSFVHIFSTLLKKKFNISPKNSVSQIVQLSQDFVQLLGPPRIEKILPTIKPIEMTDFIGIDEPLDPFKTFTQKKHAFPIPIDDNNTNNDNATENNGNEDSFDAPKKKQVSFTNMKRYTPSHIAIESNTSNPFIFNEMTKLYPCLNEYQTKYKEYIEPQPTITVQDFFQVLEDIEVNENKSDRIYAFSECNPFVGYCIRAAGKDVFGNYWTEIEQNLHIPKVRDIVINKCRSQLPHLEEEHRYTVNNARLVLATRPTNAFIASLNMSNMPMSFFFPFEEDEIVDFLIQFLINNINSKIRSIHWFVDQLIPTIYDKKVGDFIHDQTMCGVFWLFSRLYNEIKPLLTLPATEFDSFESVFDQATDQIYKQYNDKNDETCMKILYDILKGIVQHRIISDNDAILAKNKYGKHIEHLTHFYPIIVRISAACNYLKTDYHMQHLNDLLIRLGTFNGEDTEITKERIQARETLYDISVSNIKLHKLYYIHIDRKNNHITLEPYSKKTSLKQ